MANLRTNNLSGEQGRNAIKGSVVFGGGDDSSAGLTIADNSDLELSSETNWTIEFWLWLNGPTHGDYDVILGKGSATGNNYEYFVEVMSDNTLEFLTTSTGSAWTFQQQISPVLSHDSWHHVAVVRNGSGSNSLKSYINGQEYGSFTAESIHTSAYPFGIGYFAGGNNLYSKITLSNLRIVKGTSVYTAAFTPPFEELTAIPNTVLLCCQDSDNPFKEETGKTITGVGHLANGAVIHPRNIPPYGVDAGNTFGGPIQQSSQGYMYFPTGRTEERGRGRAVIMGGVDSPNPYMTRIDFFNIQTSGNSIRFGDLSFGSRDAAGSVSSTIRAVYAGGMGPSSEVATNSMSFITIATQGDGTDYGDLTAAKRQGEGCSNGVRGIFMGGENDSPSPATYNNVIDFCTIASIGNASDFGDLTAARDGGGVCSSPIRGVCGGGYDSGNSNIIDFVTIATTGNASDFGDLTAARTQATGCASATRGLFMGGRIAPNNKAEIDFITIASAGNASDFGDLSEGKNQATATASQTRGVHIGGNNGSSPYNGNTMEFVTIASTGNSTDFGDTYEARTRATASDCHGGLS
jgi:hypothetical protein